MPVTLFLSPSTLVRSREHILGMMPLARTFCDSATMHLLLRLRQVDIPLASFDLSETIGIARGILARASKESQRILAVGGTEMESKRFRDYVTTAFGIKEDRFEVAHGYQENVIDVVLKAMAEWRPHLLLVGLGAPLQEYVAARCAREYPQTDIYTCGGFITQTAIAGGPFYPAIFDRTHTRWLYRLFRQPHVIRRLFTEYLPGFWLALRLGRRLRGNHFAPPA
jgi:N-acetylglucosaminyldiphosphoundecaprenol N-acetyl-beta-D-mannosaminyltransferase